MVDLIPMTDADFNRYLETAIEGYAQDLIRAGNVHPDQARDRSEQQFYELLPYGLASADQYLYAIVDGDLQVGFLWLGVRDSGGRTFVTIYDFLILEHYRRQGYGLQALHALEGEVRDLGFDEVRLHVFGHNQGARALYEKAGYVPTNITMAKKLD